MDGDGPASGFPRRPNTRRTLDSAKIVTRPEAGAAEVSTEMEALISLIDTGDDRQDIGWLAMHAAPLREGLHDCAARAELRMAALEDKAFENTSLQIIHCR